MDRVLKAHEHLTERGKASVAYAIEILPQTDGPKQEHLKCQTLVPEPTEFIYIMFYEPTVFYIYLFLFIIILVPFYLICFFFPYVSACPARLRIRYAAVCLFVFFFKNTARSRTIGSTGLCCTLHANPFIRGTARLIMWDSHT